MKYTASKKIISGLAGIAFLITGLWFIPPYIKEASADAWLGADAHVIDGYTNGCWYCSAPKAPTSMQILLHGGGNFDGATSFEWDCDNDGIYEGSGSGTKANSFNPGDGTIMIEWSNGWNLGSHSWNVYGGGENQYWYELRISCSYQTGGGKQVNMKVSRGGLTAGGSTTFSLQNLTFNFSMGIPANGDYHPPINDQSTGATDPGTAAPSNVDVGIGMREEACRNCYQDDGFYKAFDTRGFTYEVDCNGDGVYSEKSGSSNNSNFYIWPGYSPRWSQATFADNVCRFEKAGYYRVGFKIKDPTGREHTLSQDVYLRSSESFAVYVYPAGEQPGATSYVFGGPQSVGLSFKITGLTPINTGSYSTTVDCGNGQTVSGPGGGRNYPEGTLLAENYVSCNYSQPGVHTVVAKFQEYKPASETFPAKSGEGKTKIVITGESGGVWTVVSPFSLEWNVSNATSCAITGLNDGFSATGLPTSGTRAVPKVATKGNYDYRISCTGAGGTTQETIKLNVVDILP